MTKRRKDDTVPHEALRAEEPADATRRGFLLAGVGLLLTGCAQPAKESVLALPSPAWDISSTRSTGSAPVEMYPPIGSAPATASSVPPVPPVPRAVSSSAPTIARTRWASGSPVPALMNRMTPIRYVTIHHDGMRPFFHDDQRSAAARLDAIRRAHRGRKWGDIGYHYAVDRAGNVWDCRPLAYQGAHVKNYNPGNVGIVALGNFDEQQPTQAQLVGLHRQVVSIMRTYRVPTGNLRTHMQWAATRCPGRHLQHFVKTGMNNGMFG